VNDLPQGDGGPARQLVPVSESVPALRDPYGRLAPYGVGDEAEQPGFKLLEYLRILDKRKWLILSIAAAFVVISAVRVLMETPVYSSTVRIQVDQEARIVEGGSVVPDSSQWDFMQTQYKLLEGHAMAERVASALKLGDNPDFLDPKGFSIIGSVMQLLGLVTSSDGDQRDSLAAQRQAAGIVWGNRAVRPVPNSRLVDITYTDPDPRMAQRIANAYADSFIASNIDKRFQANESAKVFLDDKIKQLKLRLENSEKALVDFAQQEQIVVVQEKESIVETNLATANSVGTAAIEGLRKTRNELELEYQEKLKTFKPAYPTMVQIKTKIDEINRQIEAETEGMRTKVSGLKAELLDLQKRSIQYNILKREADINRELYASLLQRYKEVDVASGVGVNNVYVVDKAGYGTPSSTSLLSALIKALMLGLGLGVAVAFLLERLDDRVHSAEEAEMVTGLSALGVIPKVRDVEAEMADPQSPLNEAHRSLCTALQFTTESGVPKTLAITSAGPGEGKSLTALSIAKHFATMGRKVLLIDADLRNPSQHIKLGCDNTVGLSNCLTGACTPPEAMQKTDMPSLAFIASGPLPPNAADLLGGPRLVSLFSVGQEIFDLIIIDGPPVLGLADAQLLSSAASATLFIVGAGITRKGLIRGAIKRLELSRSVVIGVALTKYDSKISGYGYGYGYGYSYSYGRDRGAAQGPGGLRVRDAAHDQPQLTRGG